jgi:PhzF family phenazine biosynthesis protein
MHITAYHIDTFTDKLFSGNPAEVCILEKHLSDETLQNIAAENNLPATVFLLREKDIFKIRWFCPEYEIDLCGHGTLAAGYVIFNILEPTWHTVSLLHPTVGFLNLKRNDASITLDLPAKTLTSCNSTDLLIEGLSIKPKEIYEFKKERILAVYETENEIKQLIPNIDLLKQLDHRGIIVTAKGDTVDFVSRVFYPKKTISEDPVTGSSYCLLVPYWANKLNKVKFNARQLSKRGGEVECELSGECIYIKGRAVLYKHTQIHLTP